jgi:hypothetical protein
MGPIFPRHHHLRMLQAAASETIQVPDAVLPEATEPAVNAEPADEADVEPGLPLELSEANVAHVRLTVRLLA